MHTDRSRRRPVRPGPQTVGAAGCGRQRIGRWDLAAGKCNGFTPDTSPRRHDQSGEGLPRAVSPDVRCAHPGLHSLGCACAAPSMAALVTYAVSTAGAAPCLPNSIIRKPEAQAERMPRLPSATRIPLGLRLGLPRGGEPEAGAHGVDSRPGGPGSSQRAEARQGQGGTMPSLPVNTDRLKPVLLSHEDVRAGAEDVDDLVEVTGRDDEARARDTVGNQAWVFDCFDREAVAEHDRLAAG